MNNSEPFAHEIMVAPAAILSHDQSISDALWILQATDSHGLPVCHGDSLVGFVSMSDIVWHYPPTHLTLHEVKPDENFVISVPQLTVGDIMTIDVITAFANDTLGGILDTLTRRHIIHDKYQHITGIPIIEPNRKVIGMINYVDLLKKIDLNGLFIGQIMKKERIPTVNLYDTLEAAHHLMQSFGERFILVLDKKRFPIGMLSDLQITRYMNTKFDFSKLPVHMAMTDLSYFAEVAADDNLSKVIPLFTNPAMQLRAFPVTSNHHLQGVISYLDILRAALEFKTSLQLTT